MIQSLISLRCRGASFEVCEDTVGVFGPDREANRALLSALLNKLCVVELRVDRDHRVNHQVLHVCNICGQEENLQIIGKDKCPLLAALNIEGESGRTAVRGVLLIERVVRVICERRVIHLLNLQVLRQELGGLQRVLDMAFRVERQGLGALQGQGGVGRGDDTALVAEQNCVDVGDKRCRTRSIREGYAVIARIRIRNIRELATLLPAIAAAIHNDAAERGTVAADELRYEVSHNVRAVPEWTSQVGRVEGVIHDNR